MTSSLDAQTRRAERNGRVLDLTKTEFDLLELLMMNAGIVLTRDTIYQRIWGYDFETSSRSLDVYVGYLRTKTEAGGEPRLLHTDARRRIRAQGAMSLRWRIALGLALIAAIVGTAAATGAYLSTAATARERRRRIARQPRTRDANIGPARTSAARRRALSSPGARSPVSCSPRPPRSSSAEDGAITQCIARRTDVAGRRADLAVGLGDHRFQTVAIDGNDIGC